ncbi:hypothetical protein AU195_19205 [Mycobacterium sp. IS-1496]|uniref:hypothetical protein n=1 Tax=Mycobacterium sp. IS-1496 TaxID=1772284 RepID=UPI0007418027|nr:hypothetical protein [Mycobacterium sp. IS-1496]KUI37224.1 hypothetical protein AU195_19205 [Mycobacterium sp. IS-1496]
MHIAARSYLSTGVALVGAGAIAISPVAPPLPDAKVPSLSTIGVELNAAVNPIQTWIEVFGEAAENLSILGQSVAQNPAPILQQVIQNQLSYIEQLTPAFQEFAEGFVAALNPSNPDGIPANVHAAVEQIVTGNPAEGFPALFQAFLTPILFPALGVLMGVQEVITASAENMLDVANMAVTAFATVALGAILPVASVFSGLGAATQAIVDAAVEGDILGAVTAVLDVPGVVTGAFLNGFGFDGGLLTAGSGTIAGLLNLRQMIADALKPAAPVSRVADVSSTNTEPAPTVTFDITESGVTPAAFTSAPAGDVSENPAPEPGDGAAAVDETVGEKAGDEETDLTTGEESSEGEASEEEALEEELPAEDAVDDTTEDDVLETDAPEEETGDDGTTEQAPSGDDADDTGDKDTGDKETGENETEGAEA